MAGVVLRGAGGVSGRGQQRLTDSGDTARIPTPRRRGKRRVTLSLAVFGALVCLGVGVLVGYAARGGPSEPVLVTTEQDLPVVTVTTEEPLP